MRVSSPSQNPNKIKESERISGAPAHVDASHTSSAGMSLFHLRRPFFRAISASITARSLSICWYCSSSSDVVAMSSLICQGMHVEQMVLFEITSNLKHDELVSTHRWIAWTKWRVSSRFSDFQLRFVQIDSKSSRRYRRSRNGGAGSTSDWL